ncbi:uncharacterized protein LOC133779610 [Humulus lupulus]|uniref:uncharacterized protein LOC133779610 n=1 Tax=Humulus lupulus TaxID=3486 RepID=UPI002B40CEE3|nr:uncharacterized protein LOC133779610 [Humulus lupulus]
MARRRKLVQNLVQQEARQELPSSNDDAPALLPSGENSEPVDEENLALEFPEIAGNTGIVPSLVNQSAPDLGSSSWAEELDIEEIEVEASFWKSALICVVVGANPPLSVFEGLINRIWGKIGVERVARMNTGFTMVKFKDEATRDLVLESGVIHFDKKPVVLRPWTIDIDSLKSIKSVPVWIRLPDLGLQYWGVNCLSALVSTIGKPIMIDKITKERLMIKFARVLVDMEISETLPQYISYINERGQAMEQLIDFKWLPRKCSQCKKLGHTATSCKFETGAVWRKKEALKDHVADPTEPKVIGNISVAIHTTSTQA